MLREVKSILTVCPMLLCSPTRMRRQQLLCLFSCLLLAVKQQQQATALTAASSGVKNRRDVIRAVTIATTGLLLPSTATSSSSSAQTGVVNLAAAGGGSGIKFPLVSFGLQIYNDDTAYKLTLTALEVGYRNFFASVLAGNQRGFARAVRVGRHAVIDRAAARVVGR